MTIDRRHILSLLGASAADAATVGVRIGGVGIGFHDHHYHHYHHWHHHYYRHWHR